MITIEQLTTGFVLFVVALVLAAVVELARNGLAGAMDRIDQRRHVQAERDAATFGEPTREQVEARVDADAAWASILRAVDASPAEVRAAYAAARRDTTHP